MASPYLRRLPGLTAAELRLFWDGDREPSPAAAERLSRRIRRLALRIRVARLWHNRQADPAEQIEPEPPVSPEPRWTGK